MAQDFPTLQFRSLSQFFQFSHDETSEIKQDSIGYIWVCNRGGLDRFDGTEVKSYRFNSNNKNSISSNYVTNLDFARSGLMFVATRSHLNLFNPKTEKFYPIYLNVPENMKVKYYSIIEYYKENDDLYWVTTTAGLYKGIPSKMIFERVPFNQDYEYENYHNFMFGIDSDKNGNLWIASWAGLFKYNIENQKFTLYKIDDISPNPGNFSVMSYLKFGPNGKLYITTWSEGMFELDIETMKAKQFFFEGDGGVKVRGAQKLLIVEDMVYIATVEGGLAILKDNKLKSYPHKVHLPGSIISGNTFSSFIDRDGNLWMSTHYGVSTAQKNSFIEDSKFYFADKRRIWINEPHTLVKLDSTHFLADTYNGIYVWDSEKGDIGKADKYSQLPKNAFEGHFVYKGNDQYYYKYQNKLLLYTIKNGYISEPETLFTLPDGSYFHQFLEDTNGGFWLSFYMGLGYYHPKTGEYFKWGKGFGKNFTLQQTIIHAFHYDKFNHQLWFSEENFGLVRVNCSNFTANFYNKSNTKNFYDNVVISALQFDKSHILFGTRSDGLYSFDIQNNEFSKIVGSNSIIGNEIYQLIQISPDKAMIKSAAGIFVYNLKNKQLHSLLKSNGMYNVPSMNSVFFCADSNLYFFDGVNVIHKINPRKISPIRPPKKPYLEEVTVSGNKHDYVFGTELKLPYNKNSVAFSFTQFDFENPGFRSFTYELQGSDNRVKRTTTNKVIDFANLSPGNYKLKVWSLGTTGLSSTEAFVIPIKILPPFYSTWWFITLVIILVGLVFYTIYKLRLSKILEIQEIRNKLARDLHDDVGSTLSGISMFSKLAKELAVKDTQKSIEIIENIGEKSRSTLENISDIVWHINPENDNIEKILARMRNFGVELFDNSNTNFILVDEKGVLDLKLSIEVKKNLFLLFKEAINNSLKYAQAKNVTVRVYFTKSHIHLDITDDGLGFDFVALKRVNGINNMRKRAEMCKGSFVILSEPGVGTTIRCKFPLNK
jgi:ligand-binding sensor domain-containing protein